MGDLPVCLQPQNHTVLSFVALYSIGANSDPLWLPSQNGCLVLCPQEHHQ